MAKTLPSSYSLTLTYDSVLFLPFFSDYFVSIKSLCSSRDRTSPNKLFLSEAQSIVFWSRSKERKSMARTTCMCSPSMRCGLHRPRIPRPETGCEQGLRRPQLSGSRSWKMPMIQRSEQSPAYRSGVISVHGEVARRALLLSTRRSGSQKVRRTNFQRKPSRLSRASMATDYWRNLKKFDWDWVGFLCFLISKEYICTCLNPSVLFCLYESCNFRFIFYCLWSMRVCFWKEGEDKTMLVSSNSLLMKCWKAFPSLEGRNFILVGCKQGIVCLWETEIGWK